MSSPRLLITPATKVAALLEEYPELEDGLVALWPPFKKLRNPLLRRSVAKVASLRQAAAVGQVPLDKLISRLRTAVGQTPMEPEEFGVEASYFGEQPD